MFGFNKKKTNNTNIFSASEAKKMVLDSLDKKRNDNRKEIFRQIKYAIDLGAKSVKCSEFLFKDGNDVYFEGLGYKVYKIWSDHKGDHLTEPIREQSDVFPPDIMSVAEQGSSGGYYYGSTGLRSSYVPMYSVIISMKVSWE